MNGPEDYAITFDSLQTMLTEAPILTYPNPKLPFILDMDTSTKGLGAVTSQMRPQGERVVAYFSQMLLAPSNYYMTCH